MSTISFCIIVRDEEEVLERCLDSIRPLADEIIVVDTGSMDRTMEIAARYTDRLFFFPWRDDFSAARNFAFSQAVMDFCMWMDADDVILPEQAERFLQMKEEISPDTDMIMLPYEAADDKNGNASFVYYRERIVKNRAGFLFQGRVHEAIPLSGIILYRDIPIRHCRPGSRPRSDRNLNIYRAMEAAGEPFCPRDLYYYGRELSAHGFYEQAIQILRKFLDCPDGWKENQIDACRQIAACCEQKGQDRQALSWLFRSFIYDLPRGETCCDIGKHFMDRTHYDLAAYWFEQALCAPKRILSGAFVLEDCYGFYPAICLCICYDKMGDPETAEAYNELAGSYQPQSPYYLQNKQYFSSRKQTESRNTS